MFSRLLLALLVSAAAAPLLAFYARPSGYDLSEVPLASGASGVVWDPATGADDFYASHDGGIRRFDTGGGSFVSTPLFAAPSDIPPASYAFFDALAIDPGSPDDFYVSYSGNFSRMYKLTRTGPDSATVVSSADYSTNDEFIFTLQFVPDNSNVPAALRGQLLAVAGEGFSGVSGVYVVDKSTLALTKIIEVTATQASGPMTIDAHGNVYAVVPSDFGIPDGAELYRFAASDVAAALTSGPLPASQAQVLIDEDDAEWNINDVTAREEDGGTFLYYGTQEHASVYRKCMATGETRLFLQGYGGVADGFPAHYAQGGVIAFSSDGDFVPAGGGDVRLAIPFGVSTVGSGSYYSIYFLEPEPVNVAVDDLVIIEQPGDINDGVPFSFRVEALNSSGTPILSNVGVVVTLNGAGDLHGFATTSQPGDDIVLDGLVYTASTVPETITLTVAVAGAPSVAVTTATTNVVAPAVELAVAPPGSVQALSDFDATVQLLDAGGVPVTSGPDAGREVHMEVVSGPGRVFGESSVAATGGVADFAGLIADEPGTYTLEFRSPGLPEQSVTLNVSEPEDGESDDGNDNGSNGCAATGGSSSAGLALLLMLLAGCVRLIRRRSTVV